MSLRLGSWSLRSHNDGTTIRMDPLGGNEYTEPNAASNMEIDDGIWNIPFKLMAYLYANFDKGGFFVCKPGLFEFLYAVSTSRRVSSDSLLPSLPAVLFQNKQQAYRWNQSPRRDLSFFGFSLSSTTDEFGSVVVDRVKFDVRGRICLF
jgi:hypothetical protein